MLYIYERKFICNTNAMKYLVASLGEGITQMLMVLAGLAYIVYTMYSKAQKEREEQARRKMENETSLEPKESFNDIEQSGPYFTYEAVEYMPETLNAVAEIKTEDKKYEDDSFYKYYEEEATTDFDLRQAIIHQIILEKKYV